MSGFSVFGCPGNLSISQEDMDAFIRSYQNQTASYNLGGLTALVNIIGTSFYDTGKLIILELLRTENQRNQFLQYTAGDMPDYEVISALADDKAAYYRGIRNAGTLMMIVSILEMVGGIATFINGAAGMIGGSALSLVPGGIAFGAVTVTAGGAIDAIAEVEIDGKRLTLKDLAIYSNEGDIPNEIGYSEFKKWLNAVKNQAREQGFEELQLTGQRAEHSISANPGSIINRVFKLKSGGM